MTALIWDEIGSHYFETGISKAVLYLTDTDRSGVPWNGLTSVEENSTTEVEPVYFDGNKYDEIVTLGDYSATLRAWTYPDEFLNYEGIYEEQSGYFITSQPISKFGLAYQTRIGNDLDNAIGYKLHVVYNLTAIPSTKTYKTLSMEVEPFEFEWSITGIPETIENYRPTAHVIFDSRKIDSWLLEDIESILYGDDDSDAYLPSLKGLSTFIRKWDRLIITDNGDGTWTATTPREGQITMIDEDIFSIESETVSYLNPYTYTISSSDKNEEDIWAPS